MDRQAELQLEIEHIEKLLHTAQAILRDIEDTIDRIKQLQTDMARDISKNRRSQRTIM